jgi:hypothetical protein
MHSKEKKIGLGSVLSSRWWLESALMRKSIGHKGTLSERWGLESILWRKKIRLESALF